MKERATKLKTRHLSGGAKHKWLMSHREEILTFYAQNGEWSTRMKYRIMNEVSWRNLLLPGSGEIRSSGYTTSAAGFEIAMLKADMARECALEVKRDVAELKAQYERFVELVSSQLARKFLIPLLEQIIELPGDFDKRPVPDQLSLDTVLTKLKITSKISPRDLKSGFDF